MRFTSVQLFYVLSRLTIGREVFFLERKIGLFDHIHREPSTPYTTLPETLLLTLSSGGLRHFIDWIQGSSGLRHVLFLSVSRCISLWRLQNSSLYVIDCWTQGLIDHSPCTLPVWVCLIVSDLFYFTVTSMVSVFRSVWTVRLVLTPFDYSIVLIERVDLKSF